MDRAASAAVLMMSPAMPTGALLDRAHWEALGAAMSRTDAWLIYDAAMERIRFDDREPAHPATVSSLVDRTITVGSASKELRMIGWRVGWVVGPQRIMRDIHLVGLSNVVCQVGLAQEAVAAALSAPDADADIAAATATWRTRADHLCRELAHHPIVPPRGGWSLLMDCDQLDNDAGRGIPAAVHPRPGRRHRHVRMDRRETDTCDWCTPTSPSSASSTSAHVSTQPWASRGADAGSRPATGLRRHRASLRAARYVRLTGTRTTHIEPGPPWDNPFAESFNTCVRDELLAAR